MTLAVAKWLTEDEAHTIHYLLYCMQELGHPIPDEIVERCNNILTEDLRDIKDRFINNIC